MKKDSSGIQEQSLVLPFVASLVLAAIIALFIISIAGIAHSVFIIAALAATAGAMMVGSNFKSLVESWDPGARSSRIGWKNRRVNLEVRNRLERRVIILPTMIITFLVNLVMIAGTLFIFQITLAEDREPVYMHALLVNVAIGGLVTMAIKILTREVKIATMIAPAVACIALALLVAGSMNGDFSNPFVKYPLAGIAMVVPSLMLHVDGLKHERWGISGMLVVISWMTGGIISGIVAKPGDLAPITPWLYLIIGILLVIALVMRFLRDIYLPYYKHPRGVGSQRTGDVNGDSE
ncbi:hypothetical protein GF325_03310 [Candidatus Bathyarchaeota archaeon]|nr:hypothetical protein [Candidatus Bathyarchaeota archaeon]